MRRLLAMLWVAVFAGMVCAMPPVRAEDGTPYTMEGPQVLLPAGVTGQKNNGPDFVTYTFKQGGRQVLFAYVGFAPEFPQSAPKGVQPYKAPVNGLAATTCLWADKQGAACRETLVKTGRTDFAKVIHFAYNGLSPAEAQAANAVIASTRPAAPKPVTAQQVQAAGRILRTVPFFAIGGIGRGGTRAPGEAALRTLIAGGGATLPALVKKASIAGQLYALLGLKQTDPAAFARAVTPYLTDKRKVHTFRGCITNDEPVAKVAGEIEYGLYDGWLTRP